MHTIIRTLVLAIAILASQALAQVQSKENWTLTVTSNEATTTYDPASKKSLKVIRPAINGAVSADGTRLAHTKSIRVGSSSATELFVSNIDANGKLTNQRQITNGAANAMQPQWTPDGKQVVYVRGEGKFQQVYITGADDDKWSERRVSAGGVRSFNPRIAPSGAVAYLAERGRDGKATLVDLIIIKDGKANPVVENTAITEFAWSPDSNQIAYSTHGELMIVDVASRKTISTRQYAAIDERLYAHHAAALAWRPDGKAIAASIQFSGGVLIMPGEKPQPMFGEREVFIIPFEGKATWFEVGAPAQDLQWTRSLK
jgi:Tol biopolymer transport system component